MLFGIEIEALLWLSLAGLLIATAAMAIGIGGGILWTPLLILGYGLPPTEAVTTSLIIQVAGMGSGAWSYRQQGLLVPSLTLKLFLAALPGVLLGSFFTVRLPEHQVQLALGLMAMTLAFLFVAGQEPVDEPPSSAAGFDAKLVRSILPVPAFFGLLMGMLSVGIGEWVLPLLKGRLHMEMRRAIGTVVAMMFLLALVAASLHALLADRIYWEYILPGALGTLMGGQIGPRINRHLDDRLLKEGFIYLMTLVGIHLIFKAV